MPVVHEMLERNEAGNVVMTYVTSASASSEERGEAATVTKEERVDIVVRHPPNSHFILQLRRFVCTALGLL